MAELPFIWLALVGAVRMSARITREMLVIVLTTVLFPAVFTIGGGMIKGTREGTMIKVGPVHMQEWSG